MTDEQQHELLKKIYYYRGIILQRTIELEKIMDLYIAGVFTTEYAKKMELMITLVTPHNFSEKISIFIHLLEVYNMPFRKQHANVIGNLMEIKNRRNMFAHWPVEMSPESVAQFIKDGSFTLVKFKAVKVIPDPKDGIVNDPTNVNTYHWDAEGVQNTLLVIKQAILTLQPLVEPQTPPPRQ